jgi:hypothetical protein
MPMSDLGIELTLLFDFKGLEIIIKLYVCHIRYRRISNLGLTPIPTTQIDASMVIV